MAVVVGRPAGRLALILLLLGASAAAWAVEGVTFYAPFDHWFTAERAAGRRLPLKVVGGTLAPGKVGQALALDGMSYLEFPPAGNVAVGKGTVALWFQPAQWGARTYDNCFGLSDNDENCLHFERSHPSGKLRFTIGGPGTRANRSIFSQEPLVNGRWYHCVATWDTAAQRAVMYLDGVEQSSLRGPGPLPGQVPTLLIGAGFGRLQRTVKGLLDEVVILDHAATAEEVQELMKGSLSAGKAVTLPGKSLDTVVRPEEGTVTCGTVVAGGSLVCGPLQAVVKVGDRETVLSRLSAGIKATPVARAPEKAQHRCFAALDAPEGLKVELHVQVRPDDAQALLWTEITNQGAAPVRVSEIALRSVAGECLLLPGPPSRQRVFLDNGSLCGSGSHNLATPQASHTAAGALVVTDPVADWALSLSFTSFRLATVHNRVKTDAAGAPAAVEAVCTYPNGHGLAPGATLSSEVFEVALRPSGHGALERWADSVMAVNDLQPPRHCVSGWNSWYAYRLTISEDIVLANARIIQERFAPLGVRNVQIDHGWQHRDIVGHWVANERFPQGLPWLAGKLKQMGLTFGLWTAVTDISEFAPEYAAQPEIMARDAQGQPYMVGDHWYWAPHGKTFAADPTSPAGAAYYRDAGAKVKSYGCSYLKNDFQAHLTDARMKLHDANATLGTPIWREFTRLLREGMGPEMAYMACNAPLNLVAGLCDAAWVHRDIGNPAGSWEHLRGFANDFACRYHVSGKFYWSDPDYLQIGQGDLDENRIRMAWCALWGGPAFLGDRLPDLPEAKLVQLTKCFPSYRECGRPVDLFTRDGYARVWDLPVKTKWGGWHVVGLFNLDEQDEQIALDLRDLGLAAGQPLVVWDFFAEKLLGELAAEASLGLNLRVPVPQTSCRLLRLTPRLNRPFVLSTDLHLTQGGVELPQVKWDAKTLTLSGVARRMPGLQGKVFVYVPEGYLPTKGKAAGRVLAVPLSFKQTEQAWQVGFRQGT